MSCLRCKSAAIYLFLWLLLSLIASFTWAQSETATVSGQVVDPSGLNITGAQVKLVDIDRDTSTVVTTNSAGLYAFPSVRPGRYRIQTSAVGFRAVNVTGLTVNVQDHLQQNFSMVVGSVSESITVEGGTALVDTESATVSTVVDRNFAENLPMNGRSFQTLIELTPGVVLTTSTANDPGQFSVNGQRASSNYWMLDGVSANIGMSPYVTPGGSFGGTVGSFSVLGGTNSLVSIDAMQEFRIQTSTYAPEFGRTPGAQISIVTRPGSNQFQGTAFDYFRNDVLDANNWFNSSVVPPLPKAKERQNDFGGTLSGPILKNKTFFFFSYEGLRLQLPESALTNVPDSMARQNATPAMKPYLNAFPLPNGTDNTATGVAQFNGSFSDPASLDAYSLRIDHKLNDRFSVFGRYSYSPSKLVQRGGQGGQALSDLLSSQITTQTGTLGATLIISPESANDFRLNYSRTDGSSKASGDNYGGAVPLPSVPFPSPFTLQNANLFLDTFALPQSYEVGALSHNLLQQFNIVDTVSMQKGTHGLKFGVDYRRISASRVPFLYEQDAFFPDMPSFESGGLLEGVVEARVSSVFLLRNLGVFAQDTWRLTPHLTLTYGLRWDVDFTPASVGGPDIPAVTGYNLNDFSQLALAPLGTVPYHTRFGDVAPRVGAAYQINQNPDWGSVLRGGLGVFYDLASGELGNLLGFSGYPFSASNTMFGPPFGTSTFPFSSGDSASPAITPGSLSAPSNTLTAFDPNLRLPYTLQWSVAFEQALGRQQTLSTSYVGSVGSRLIQSAFLFQPNANFTQADLVGNTVASNYNAVQVQFQRHLSHGLQALASYTWSHSIDDASAGSYGNGANTLVPGVDPNQNRGPSDFDTRDAFSTGLTYTVPSAKISAFANTILSRWSLDSVVQARSALPVNVYYSAFNALLNASADVRPDVIPGLPPYLYGPQYPGEKALNPGAFTSPPTDANGNPIRQGTLGRNSLRGFGAAQWDFSVHRDFPIHESLKLQFRAEMFNLLNHPNFAPPVADLGSPQTINPQFGRSTQMLAQSLGGNVGSGGFDPLYQLGGPRSIQLALKLTF